MSDEKKAQTLSVSEATQVTEELLKWLRGYELSSYLEFSVIPERTPSLTLVVEGSQKSNYNVLGDYDGEIVFTIYSQVKGQDTATRLGATGELTRIGGIMDSQTIAKDLPELSGGNTCLALSMESIPTIYARSDNGTELYSASYVLKFRHKNNLFR